MFAELLEVTREKVRSSSPYYSDKYDCGMYCYYMRLSEKWGLKLYRGNEIRNKTYNLQKVASEYGLAPQVGDTIEIDTPDGQYFGYITENVTKTMPQYESDDELYENVAEYPSLIENLEYIELAPRDIHGGNVGYLPNGKLVCIDFSHF